MPDPTPSSPTICAKCEHCSGGLIPHCKTPTEPKYSYVTGQMESIPWLCSLKNMKGKCPDYKERQ